MPAKTEPLRIVIETFEPIENSEDAGLLTVTLHFRGEVRTVQALCRFEPVAWGHGRQGRALVHGAWVTVTGLGFFDKYVAEAFETWYIRTLALAPKVEGITHDEALQVLKRYHVTFPQTT